MSYKRAASGGAGTGALLERRNKWVTSLRASLPSFAEATAAPLQSSRLAAIFRDAPPRHALDDAVSASLLRLPPRWQEDATRCLAQALHGVVPAEDLRRSDYFLCSLIHPTYVQSSTVRHTNEAQRRQLQQQLRRSLCMPPEVTMTGHKSLRVLRSLTDFVATSKPVRSASAVVARRDGASALRRENAKGPDVAAKVSSSSSATFALDAPWPELRAADTRAFLSSLRQCGLESLVLFDPHAIPPNAMSSAGKGESTLKENVPSEVSLAAFTALCGSIEVVSGWTSLVQYVDRVAREQRE